MARLTDVEVRSLANELGVDPNVNSDRFTTTEERALFNELLDFGVSPDIEGLVDFGVRVSRNDPEISPRLRNIFEIAVTGAPAEAQVRQRIAELTAPPPVQAGEPIAQRFATRPSAALDVSQVGLDPDQPFSIDDLVSALSRRLKEQRQPVK